MLLKIYAVCRGIQGKEQDKGKRDSEKFNINRLFEAVASGDVKNLDGLHQYLDKNMKKLSDSLCECERTPRCSTHCELLTCVLTPRTFSYTCRSVLWKNRPDEGSAAPQRWQEQDRGTIN